MLSKLILVYWFYMYSVFFFMETKVFVHLTHLELPQISQIIDPCLVWTFKKNTPGMILKIHFEKIFETPDGNKNDTLFN